MIAASCFSGIGGAEMALPEAHWIWCAEIEKFPSAVLDHHFGHTNLGDITAPDFIDRARSLGRLDLLAGGPPCQAFSVAGLRKGMTDPRGQLSIRFLEIAHAIRPRNLAVENVPGWLNHEDNAFGCFLGGLVGADDALLPCERPRGRKGNEFWRWHDKRQELVPTWPSAGMVAGPWARAAWRVLDAQYSGLAQRRERVFLVADFGEGADPAAVLFERQGVSGNHPPRRETGEGVTGTLSARAQGGGGLGTDFECQGGLQPVGFGGGNQSGDVIAQPMAVAIQAGALRENPNSGPDGVGVQQDVAYTLEARAEVQAVAFPERMSATQYGATENLCPTLGATNPTAVAFDLRGREGGAQFEGPHDTANIRAASGGSSRSYVADQWAVRRLTPTECERLQGYPDGHTLIEFGSRRTVDDDEAAYLAAQGAHVVRDNKGRWRTNTAADGPRYKVLGNAWAVSCARPVLRAIMDAQTP